MPQGQLAFERGERIPKKVQLRLFRSDAADLKRYHECFLLSEVVSGHAPYRRIGLR